ncbi:MAG: hypothetical protein ACTSPI_00785 [Candidatus Heimdallarchaeaceae archaeon]
MVQKDGFLTVYNMEKEADRKQYRENIKYKKMEKLLDSFVEKVVNHKLLDYDVMFKKLKKIFEEE